MRGAGDGGGDGSDSRGRRRCLLSAQGGIGIRPSHQSTSRRACIYKGVKMSLRLVNSLVDPTPGGERRQVAAAAAALVQCSHVESHEPLARAN